MDYEEYKEKKIPEIILNTVELENKYLITQKEIFQTIFILNNRIDKAIEYINGNYYINEHEWNDETIKKAINILQGSEDNE